MNLDDELQYGHFTLRKLSALIEDNMRVAQECSVRLSWSLKRTYIQGEILLNEVPIFEKKYNEKYFHLSYAQMHRDFSFELINIQAAIRKKAAEESKHNRNKLPSINDVTANEFGDVKYPE